MLFSFSPLKGPVNENGISLAPCFQNTAVLGATALIASIAFLVRGVHLKRHGRAHGLGHILVYWPQQIAIVVAIGALIAHLWSASAGGISTSFAFGFLLVAWVSTRIKISEGCLDRMHMYAP
jgi:hypothetical protein